MSAAPDPSREPVVRRRPEPPAWTAWGKLIAALLVVALLVFLIAQIFTGCLIPLPNELAKQPSFGYVEPPRLVSPAEAIPFQGPVAAEAFGLPVNPVSYTVESLARGQEAYGIYCVLCHGEPGTGTPGPVGELFQPPPPDLGERVVDLPDGQIYTVISQGFGRMPALDWNLAEDGRWHVINYLRSVTTGPPPEAQGSPTQRAALLYNLQCATCHGPSGRGALGPALYPSAFITEARVEDIAGIIIAGRTSRGMPSFSGYVSEEEAAGMAEFLKLLQREGPVAIEETRRRLVESGVETPGVPGSTTTTAPSGQTTTTAPSGQTTTTEAPSATTTTEGGGGLVATGRQVFTQNCRTCHGEEGTGGGIGPVLQGNQFVQQASDADLQQLIEQGRAGTPMPPFAGRLTNEQITAVIALLRSWQGGTSSLDGERAVPSGGSPRLAVAEWRLVANTLLRGVPRALPRPAVNRNENPRIMLAQTGATDLGQAANLFEQNCSSCHGTEGTGGGIGPVLQGNQFVQQASDADLQQLIEQGRAGTPMPPFGGTLSSEEIASLVGLLRSWQPGGGAPAPTDGQTQATEAGTTETTARDRNPAPGPKPPRRGPRPPRRQERRRAVRGRPRARKSCPSPIRRTWTVGWPASSATPRRGGDRRPTCRPSSSARAVTSGSPLRPRPPRPCWMPLTTAPKFPGRGSTTSPISWCSTTARTWWWPACSASVATATWGRSPSCAPRPVTSTWVSVCRVTRPPTTPSTRAPRLMPPRKPPCGARILQQDAS